MPNGSTGALITKADAKRLRRHGLRQSSLTNPYVRRTVTTYRINLENDVLGVCGQIDTFKAGLIQSACSALQRAMRIEDRLRRAGDGLSVENESKLLRERDAAFCRRDTCAREACKPPLRAKDGSDDLISRAEVVSEIRQLLAEAQRSPLPRPPLSPELQRLQEQQRGQIDMLSDLHKKRQSCGVFSDDQPANYGPTDSDSEPQTEGE
jgi:hypothetical protein